MLWFFCSNIYTSNILADFKLFEKCQMSMSKSWAGMKPFLISVFLVFTLVVVLLLDSVIMPHCLGIAEKAQNCVRLSNGCNWTKL